MTKKELTKTGKMLLWFCSGLAVLDTVLVTPQEFKRRAMRGNLFDNTRGFDSFLHYLVSKGYFRFVDRNNERFIKITNKGELKVLFLKARTPLVGKWDGKWRVVVFDIPEDSRGKRDQLRNLLKQSGFVQLQASVFINPYPLNREAIKYLKDTGLIKYIRILKVEEMDDDKDLKRKFALK